MMRPLNHLPPLLLGALLSACAAVAPDFQPPAPIIDANWASKQTIGDTTVTTSANVSNSWWQQLQDPLLSELITEAEANNKNLAIAKANIARAKAATSLASSGYFPTLSAKASANRTQYSSQTGFGANTGTRNNFNASLDASWELDLFGQTYYGARAARANQKAVEAEANAIQLALIAEIARNYFELRGFQQQLSMSERDLELLENIEAIATVQSESGMITPMELLRAQGEKESFKAKIPNIKAEISVRIYHLSILTGQAPEAYQAKLGARQAQIKILDTVPVGLRSNILKRRPDIRQAEHRLAEASAKVGVETAKRFPTFSLTGSAGSSARVFSDLFTTSTLTNSVGSLLSWPLFAGGAYEAQVDISEAELAASQAAYEQTILLALEDAESALTRYGQEWQTFKQLQQAETLLKQAADIAEVRFQAGEESLLTLLDAKRALNANQQEQNNSQTRILTQMTHLYKALGGDFSNQEAAEH